MQPSTIAQLAIVFSLVLSATPLAAEPTHGSSTPSIIPRPVEMKVGEGVFQFTPDTRVIADGPAGKQAVHLIDALAPAMGLRLRQVDAAPDGTAAVELQLDASLKDKLGDEGYTLNVTSERITIQAAGPAGLYYGVQTLRQLLPQEIFSPEKAEGVRWSVPCVNITDYPRFAWRGLLVDPARHFIPKADLLHFIDEMALHKYNHLQIHLTDNEGWRIEIKKYPNLTEVGSRMDRTARRKRRSRPPMFYSQDDIREIVAYAAKRHITIIPEIEMPAHTGAALVAYPLLSLTPENLSQRTVAERWRKNRRVVAPRPETVEFMKNVLAEVLELFPSRYIHIGGDEAKTKHWQKSKEMQAQMKQMNHKDVHELHSWFIGQFDAYLTEQGRRMIGWDEILQGGLAPGATVMSWRGIKGGVAAARTGHDTIMAPMSHTYLDCHQGPRESEPRAHRGYSLPLDLERVYRFEPIPDRLSNEEARHILGGQGQLWGEHIRNHAHRQYMAWPRGVALIETLWSPAKGRHYEKFLVRLAEHLKRFDAAGINYRPLDAKPKTRPDGTDNGASRDAH